MAYTMYELPRLNNLLAEERNLMPIYYDNEHAIYIAKNLVLHHQLYQG